MSEETFAAFPQALQDRIAQHATSGIKRKPMAMPVTGPAPVHAPVKVQDPGFTNPLAEGEGISVALPSRFAFYDFKDLYVKPFRAFHLAKLSKAHEDRSLLPMVEAVSSVLFTTSPGHQALGFKLGVADFYFILYWLKLHSFNKATLVNTTYCLNPEHLKKVQDGLALEDSLKIVTSVTNSQLVINNLETLPDPERFVLPEPYVLRPATMQDTVEFLENPNWLDAEYQYLGKLASNFTSKEKPDMTLAAKIEVLNNFDGDTCFLLQDYEKAIDSFGVEESITIKCNGCGVSRVSLLTLDAHSFLSA